jgi:hypothetical protein
MKQYQRGVDHPEGPVPPQEVLQGISGDLDALNQKLRVCRRSWSTTLGGR